MKDWAVYKEALTANLINSEIGDEEMIDRIILSIEKFLGSHLPCAYCGRILEDEHFHKGKVCASRRGRQTICKTCVPKYRTGKPFKAEDK